MRLPLRPRSVRPLPAAIALVRAGAVVLTFAAHLHAQPADSTRTSLTGVALSAPQQAALNALRGQTRGTLSALYARAGARPGAPLPAALRGSVDSVIGAHNAALRALLTDEQRPVFDDNVRAGSDGRRAARAKGRRQSTRAAAARATAATPAAPGAGAARAGARP